MKTKTFFFILAAMLTASTAMAQHAQRFMAEIQQSAQIVQIKYSTSQSMLDIAQMGGDPNLYQTVQYEMQYHQQIYGYLEQLAQNPGQLTDPAAYQAFQSVMWEYYYRTDHQDYRPAQQIQANLQAYVAQRNWEASTPEGRQAYQARRHGNQVAFDTHQRGIAEASAMQDRSFNSFMGNLRSTPTRPAGSDYDGQDAFIDSIHETTTFHDPYSGQQVTHDGQYDYWYQDNLGNYVGTDDPSFNHHGMQGNWEQIDPLTPQW